MRMLVGLLALLLVGVGVFFLNRPGGVGDSGLDATAVEAGRSPSDALGPIDGADLSPTELGRVAVGTMAPDFALDSYSDGVVRLSDYRGAKDIVLVFYRGHW